MKKGFTLIELLAVIVILAIIAVIAVPIVLNIINESKDSAMLRSADFYLDAVEYSIVQAVLKDKQITDQTYSILENGNICLSYDENDKCIDELVVEVNGEVPNGGSIKIEKGQIVKSSDTAMILKNYEITYDENDELFATLIVPFCKLTKGEAYAIGSQYVCNPGTGDETFYVLETGDETVSLLLNRNVGSGPWCLCTGCTSTSDFDKTCAGAEAKRIMTENIVEWKNEKILNIDLPSVAQVQYAMSMTANYEWLVEGLNNSGDYWTSTPASGGAPTVNLVLCSKQTIGGAETTSVSIYSYYGGGTHGIRTVIVVSKSDL